MTEREFQELVKKENLYPKKCAVVLNSGLISRYFGRYIIGCTQAFPGSKWYVFYSDDFCYDYERVSLDIPRKDLIEMKEEVMKDGKIRKFPVPIDVHITNVFDNQEDALDEFYLRVKIRMEEEDKK